MSQRLTLDDFLPRSATRPGICERCGRMGRIVEVVSAPPAEATATGPDRPGALCTVCASAD